MSGFQTTGIYPFNPDAFNDSDFGAAEVGGELAAAEREEEDVGEDTKRRIVVVQPTDAASNVAPGGASTSTVSRSTSLASMLTEIGPLQWKQPRAKSNRGRPPMKSTVLTSPESISQLKAKRAVAEKRQLSSQSKKQAPAAKRAKRQRSATPSSPSSPSGDEEFCIICRKKMPVKLSINNSNKWNTCDSFKMRRYARQLLHMQAL